MDEANEPIDTVLMLPTGLSAASIASACREAATEFVNRSQRWGKPELSMWLAGPYAHLTRHARKADHGTSAEARNSIFPVPLLREIDVRLVDRTCKALAPRSGALLPAWRWTGAQASCFAR
jgi:hypothetical protein